MGESVQVKYLFIGGGAAAAQAAVGMREVDADGSALIVCRESWWPYDRPPLSKGMLLGRVEPADAESKDPSWYDKNNVEVRRATEAVSIDRASRTVALADGGSVVYEKLLLAPGATPRALAIPGADLPGVHLLRTADQSLAIRDAITKSKTAVIVGAGYIGMEVASACLESGVKPTIIDPADRPWNRNTSEATSNFLRTYFEDQGATFLMGEQAVGFRAEGNQLSVATKGGKAVAGDFAVVGVGVTLNNQLAKGAGLEIHTDGGVVVDSHLQSADPNIYVAGDAAAYDDKVVGRRWHAEHYLNARWTGKQAGRNMAGANEPYDQVPYFFSDMLDLHMIQRGDPQSQSVSVLGDMAGGEFVELYGRPDGTLAMGLAFSHDESSLDKISDKLEELIRAKTAASGLTKDDFSL